MDHLKKNQRIGGWNWGAFFLTFIWGVGNRVWIALLAIVPGINIVMAIILGIYGNDWAYGKNRYLSEAEFKKNQKLWAKWGAIVFVLFFCALIFTLAYASNQMRILDEKNARDAQRVYEIKELISKVNRFKEDNDKQCPLSLNELIPKYLKQIPTDPTGQNYRYNTDGQDCHISIDLENPENDSLKEDDIPNNGSIYDQKSTDTSQYQIWGAE